MYCISHQTSAICAHFFLLHGRWEFSYTESKYPPHIHIYLFSPPNWQLLGTYIELIPNIGILFAAQSNNRYQRKACGNQEDNLYYAGLFLTISQKVLPGSYMSEYPPNITASLSVLNLSHSSFIPIPSHPIPLYPIIAIHAPRASGLLHVSRTRPSYYYTVLTTSTKPTYKPTLLHYTYHKQHLRSCDPEICDPVI